MDIYGFMQNVKKYCDMRGVRPTVACRESGAGERLIENIKRGSVPSVEKVQMLAQYLGVTVSELLGETGRTTVHKDDTLTPDAWAVASAYAAASPDLKAAVRRVLEVE